MYCELVDRNLLHQDLCEQLKQQFPGMSGEILANHFGNMNKKHQGYRHTDDAKKFALTLHFYSPRAYEFVRPIFSLPHLRSLCAWTSSVDCEPGFFNDVFDHVEKLVEKDGKNADVSLSVDDMGISQGREWNKHKGNVEGFIEKMCPVS